MLQKTQLGWVIGGSWPMRFQEQHASKCYVLNVQDDFSKFWEIEDGAAVSIWSEQETLCENHSQQTYRCSQESRYII